MKTKFYLRKCSKKSTINFEFRDGASIKFRASTGFTINNEKDWDLNKQKMRLPSSTINAKLINSKLSDMESELDKLYFKNEVEVIIIDVIKGVFNTVFAKKELNVKTIKGIGFKPVKEVKLAQNDLIKYYEWFLEFYAKNPSPYSKRILAKGTLVTLKNALVVLKKFLKQKKQTVLSFDNINRDFYYEFITYLNNEKYTKNYTGTIIQKLKTVMSYSFDEGFHKNLEFKKNYFSKVSEVIHHPYLDMTELKAIEELDLIDNDADLARDIFLIECYSGLRIGDLLSFINNPVYVEDKGKKFMKVTQSKTSNIVFIPLGSKFSRIMDKYNGELPPFLHQNSINAHLKSICKKAKIDAPYQYVRTEGGEKVIYNLPKYKFITTHTGRRSFCTNAYNAEVPVQDIMAISGHKTEKVFLNYIKVDLLKTASRISNNSHFS